MFHPPSGVVIKNDPGNLQHSDHTAVVTQQITRGPASTHLPSFAHPCPVSDEEPCPASAWQKSQVTLALQRSGGKGAGGLMQLYENIGSYLFFFLCFQYFSPHYITIRTALCTYSIQDTLQL